MGGLDSPRKMVPLRETCAGLPVHCKVKGLCKGERAAAMRPFAKLLYTLVWRSYATQPSVV